VAVSPDAESSGGIFDCPKEYKKENAQMQPWIKRGMQTAMITGGLMMLGTGIASASEDVNPDKPASPLDGSSSTPFTIGDNSIGVSDHTIPVRISGNEVDAEEALPAQLRGDAVDGTDNAASTHTARQNAATGDIESSGARDGALLAPRVALPGPVAGNPVPEDWAFVGDLAQPSGGFGTIAGEFSTPGWNSTELETSALGGKSSSQGNPRLLDGSEDGPISGDLFDEPTTVLPKVVDNAVAEIGEVSDNTASNHSVTTAIGPASGTFGGTPANPGGTFGADTSLGILDVPADLIADAVTAGPNLGSVTGDESEPIRHQAVDRDTVDGLPITSLPKLPDLTKGVGLAPSVGSLGQLGPASDLLGEVVGVLGRALPVDQLTGGLPVNGLTGPRQAREQSSAGSFGGGLTSADIIDALETVSSTSSGHLPTQPIVETPTQGTLSVHTPERFGIDTGTLLTPGQTAESASLAETQDLLEGLLIHHPTR
jgi:hypothetical protein